MNKLQALLKQVTRDPAAADVGLCNYFDEIMQRHDTFNPDCWCCPKWEGDVLVHNSKDDAH